MDVPTTAPAHVVIARGRDGESIAINFTSADDRFQIAEATVFMDRFVRYRNADDSAALRLTASDNGEHLAFVIRNRRGEVMADGLWGGDWAEHDLLDHLDNTIAGIIQFQRGEDFSLGCGWRYPYLLRAEEA